MRVLLISTYDLGRQPFGLASPAAWLRRAGVEVDCADVSRDPLDDARVRAADVVAFYLPMHTATRLAAPLIDRVRTVNPPARVVAYGLYAPLNAAWLRERGVHDVLGPEAEADLVALVEGRPEGRPLRPPRGTVGQAGLQTGLQVARLHFIQPDRSTLPPLHRYSALQLPDGTRRVAGTTDATRGCKHLCRHCPIVPVYRGAFRVVAVDVVMADIAAQVAAGARHITFGDPDFFNGPSHARRIVERVAAEFPGLTYDVTIKIEHLLRHADLLPLLKATGCVFVTSAVESVDDQVLARLRKQHTRADFARAVAVCRAAGLPLSPTFVPFTPWTTLDGYRDLLDEIERLELVDDVAPVQLGIRLLIPGESALLELDEVRALVEPFDATSLTWPWRHADAAVDERQREVMAIVSARRGESRRRIFDAISSAVGRPPRADGRASTPLSPYMTEAWYCCAEPGPELIGEL